MTMTVRVSPKGFSVLVSPGKEWSIRGSQGRKDPKHPSNTREPNTVDRIKSLLGTKKHTHAADMQSRQGL